MEVPRSILGREKESHRCQSLSCAWPQPPSREFCEVHSICPRTTLGRTLARAEKGQEFDEP